MKLPDLLHPSGDEGRGSVALRGGAYSLAVAAVAVALAVAVNVLASVLPTGLTRYDISSAKLYSVTSNTKAVAAALEEDVTIYWIVQSGEEDEVIENLLGQYESLSDHILVEKRNPDVYPTFAQQYTDGTVLNNSLVVECGDRSRYISYDDIYLQETDIYSYTYSTSFDGEGAVTSAIDYVTTEELPVVYLLEGHGEAELPATFLDQVEKENIQLESLSLLTADEIPEDAACLLIHAPQSDISAEEKEMLAEYAAGGGKLFVIAGPTQEGSLENLLGLLEDYGVTAAEGIVVEADRNYYAFQTPYLLLPELEESDITTPLAEEGYLPIFPIAQGLTVPAASPSGGTVTALLTTSEQSFSKAAGYDLDTYEKEEGDADGPFAVAVSVKTGGGGELIWFASSDLLADMYNAFSSGANGDLAMNALSSLIGEREALAIRSKSLNYNYLTISDSAGSLLKWMMIGVFPLAYLGTGVAVVLRRRRMQNEAV